MRKRRDRPEVRERLGYAVRLRRGELGLTEEDLADRAGVHRTCVSDSERGGRNASPISIERPAALALPLVESFRLVEHF